MNCLPWITYNRRETRGWTVSDDIALWESIALHGYSYIRSKKERRRARTLKMRYLKYSDEKRSQRCMPPNCRSIVFCPSQKEELGEIRDDEPCHSAEECRQRRARDFTINYKALEQIVHRLESPEYSAFCTRLISLHICSRCGIGVDSIPRLHGSVTQTTSGSSANSRNSHLTSKTCSNVCQCWLYHEAQRCLLETGVSSTDKRIETRRTSIPSLSTPPRIVRAKRKRSVDSLESSRQHRNLAPRPSPSPDSVTKAILPSNATSIETGHGPPPKIAALLARTTHAAQPLLVRNLNCRSRLPN